MFLRNRVTGQVHEVPDHLVHGFHTAQEVSGFGEPLGLPFLAALAPMLTSILPAIGGLFKGGDPAPVAPPPPSAPAIVAPPAPPPPLVAPPMELPPEAMYPPERLRRDRGDMPPPNGGADVMDPDGPARSPAGGYRVVRRVRHRRRRVSRPQLHGYGWWY